MALDFPKLDFAVSFNPSTAFPLDARSYFESLEAAQAAAAAAVPAGSNKGVYYYGQTVVVVENDKASFYVIQPDKTLSSIAGATSIGVNPDLFEYDESGNLSLKGFDTEALGKVMSIGEDGKIKWLNLQDEIAAAVAGAAHLRRKIVNNVESIDVNAEDADLYIYMVPTGLTSDANKYDEYMVMIVTDGEGEETRFVEQVGSWDIDLSDYATKEDLKDKVDKVEGSRLITEEEIKKLISLENSPIKSVDTESFTIESPSGQLQLNDLPISKVVDLGNILNKGQKTEGGYYLITETDKKKLDSLVINSEDGSLEISGSVNASNVEGLSEWITSHSTGNDFVPGLSENSLTNERLAILESAITSADEANFTVLNGKLSLNSIKSSQVTDLTDLLKKKANADDFATLQLTVSDHDDVLKALSEALTWMEMTE